MKPYLLPLVLFLSFRTSHQVENEPELYYNRCLPSKKYDAKNERNHLVIVLEEYDEQKYNNERETNVSMEN